MITYLAHRGLEPPPRDVIPVGLELDLALGEVEILDEDFAGALSAQGLLTHHAVFHLERDNFLHRV